MAKPRTPPRIPPRTPPSPPTPTASRPAAALSGDVAVDVAAVAAAVSALPEPTELQVTAWKAQNPDDYILTLAAQTRAPAVLGDAWAWFQQARPALTGPLSGSIRYPLERLGFLGRCLLDLAGALTEERAVKRQHADLKAAKTSTEALAQACLADLRSAVREAAGHHVGLRAELDARLAEQSSGTTAGELLGLASLVESWLGHGDPVVPVLAASSKLTRADVEAARRHALALTQASTAKRGTRAADRDSAEVSPFEGRLLAEMRVLRNAFANARARTGDKRLPVLAPGPGTRAVFGKAGVPTDPVPQPPDPTPAPT